MTKAYTDAGYFSRNVRTIEVLIDRIMMSGYGSIELNELKTMVAQLMAESDDSFNTGSRTMLGGKDTIN